jgi:hypothetical protein
MERDYVNPVNIFPDYPRIDDVELAWDMALTEKKYRDLGITLISLSEIEEYGFIAKTLKNMAEDMFIGADLEAEVVLRTWLTDPKNPVVNKLRRKNYKIYDELEARGIDPSLHFIADELIANPPFLTEWYNERDTRKRQAQRSVKRREKAAYESKWTYLPAKSYSADEVAIRGQIFVDDPELVKPPNLKLDPRIVGGIIVSRLDSIDANIICERLGLKITRQVDPDNNNQLNYAVRPVSPHLYGEIRKRYGLTLPETYRKVKALMQDLNEYLQSVSPQDK